MSNQLEKVKELIELRAQARLGGGAKAIEKQHFQVTSCQVDTIIRCVEYFHPSAMHAIIVLKVVLIIHQDFVDDDFTARIRCGARTECTDHSRCEEYSGYVFVHN